MTILELTFATNQLTTTFLTINWNRFIKNIPFEALTIEETVPELCQLIVAEAAPILGIVADFPADFFSPEETLALVPKAVIQAFAEQLNTPLLTAPNKRRHRTCWRHLKKNGSIWLGIWTIMATCREK